jgi:hypothetical protein
MHVINKHYIYIYIILLINQSINHQSDLTDIFDRFETLTLIDCIYFIFIEAVLFASKATKVKSM